MSNPSFTLPPFEIIPTTVGLASPTTKEERGVPSPTQQMRYVRSFGYLLPRKHVQRVLVHEHLGCQVQTNPLLKCQQGERAEGEENQDDS